MWQEWHVPTSMVETGLEKHHKAGIVCSVWRVPFRILVKPMSSGIYALLPFLFPCWIMAMFTFA